MRVLLITFLIFLQNWQVKSQTVPSVIEFAGMKLKLTEEARRDIQADVDALTRSEKYFNIKLDRVNMFMPIIERVLEEEGLPDDFKYLVIQESALISDAVSTSQAVGFWQFKDFTAIEVGMRVDMQVDERMNIVASTRGAAKYLKTNYAQFGNWVYALLAYNTGRGGAADLVNEKYIGAKQMPIDRKTHWYVKKFLAHKIAFQDVLGTTLGEYILEEYTDGSNQSLKEIAKKYSVPLEVMEEYNKWLRRGKVPDDKQYVVIVPLKNLDNIDSKMLAEQKAGFGENSHLYQGKLKPEEQSNYPIVKKAEKAAPNAPVKVQINGLKGIIAPKGYTPKELAAYAEIDYVKFMNYNDMRSTDTLIPGQIYYLQKKRNRAKVYYHTVTEADSWWSISQKYGIKKKKLLTKNRLRKPEELVAGRILWLRNNRPSSVPVEYAPVPTKGKPSIEMQIEPKEEIVAEVKNDPITQSIETLAIDSAILAYQPDSIEIASNQLDTIETKVASEIPEIDTASIVQNTNIPLIHADSLTTQNQSVEEENNMVALTPDTTEKVEGNDLLGTIDDRDESIVGDQPIIQNAVIKDTIVVKTHLVKSGETLYGISKNYGISIQDLQEWNTDALTSGLKAGDELTIYFKEEVKSNQKQAQFDGTLVPYTVKSGDTLYKIARELGVSMADILKWNNKTDFEIAEGQILNIYK